MELEERGIDLDVIATPGVRNMSYELEKDKSAREK